jgi:hypothetical protein
MTKKQELAKEAINETGLSLELTSILEQNAGAGLEDISFQDKGTQFIYLLQALSPQLENIDEAKPGMAMNNITNEVYDIRKKDGPGLHVIPIGFFKEIIEWGDRSTGGGLIARHQSNTPLLQQCVKNDKNQLCNPKTGNIFVETANHAVLFLNKTNEWELGVLAMSSTKLKCSRKWNNVMTSIKMTNAAGAKFNPPMFSQVYEISSVQEKNKHGQYYNFDVKLVGPIKDKELLESALFAYNEFKRGMIKISEPLPEHEVESTVY